MYSALLVDDETWSLAGLKDSLNWEQAGLNIVYETTNSVDALQAIERVQPDIVFTDIRMPVISGIELMGKCRDKGIGTEFVLVSGYADFEYARHALQYGAFDYLLKPINEGELAKLASRLVRHLSEKSIRSRNGGLTHEPANLFVDFGNGMAGLHTRHAMYRACVLKDVEALVDGAALNQDHLSFMPLKVGYKQLALLVNYEPEAESLLQQVLRKLVGESHVAACIGISEPSHTADWNKLLEQAFKAASGRFFGSDTSILSYTPLHENAVKLWIDSFFGALTSRYLQDVRDLCDSLPETFGKVGFGVEALVYFNNSAAALLRYKYPERFSNTELETQTFDGLIAKYRNAADYAEFLYQTCEALAFSSPKDYSSNDAFDKLLDYMKDHYAEELYLTDLARNFHFSLTYLSEIFRKKTGKNFTKYLNDLRLERANELMLLTDLSVTEIAEHVGYKDYFYFSKLFKKTFGASPAHYRKGKRSP